MFKFFCPKGKSLTLYRLYAGNGDIAQPKKGLGTGNKDLFMRMWWEVADKDICFNATSIHDAIHSELSWFPHNKGGEYRKWYGNDEYIVDWFDDGKAIKNYKNSQNQLAARPQNQDCYFKPTNK